MSTFWKCLGTLGLVSSLASAQSSTWGLTWKTLPECIQTAELVQEVEEKLGRPVFGANPEFRIDGVVRRQEGNPRWKAKLTLLDASGSVLGSRDVTSNQASCRALDSSLVLVVAVMIDPAAAMGAPPTPSPSPEKEAPLVGVEPSTPVQRPRPPPQRALPFRTWLGARAGLGPAPFPSMGLLAGLEVPMSSQWAVTLRLPMYPFVPVTGIQQTGQLTGAGFGVDVGYASTPLSENKFRWLASLGLETNLFLATSTSRSDVLGRIDVLGRTGVFWPLGDAGLLVTTEVGLSPLTPVFRMVTTDGRPDDVRLGNTFRFGGELAFVLPLR